MKLFCAALLAIGLATVCADRAHACGPLACEYSTVFPVQGTLPANMVRLRVTAAAFYGAGDAGDPQPRLYRIEGSNRVPVAFDFEVKGSVAWIVPSQSLTVGTQLLLEADPTKSRASFCETRLIGQYVVGPEMPIPALLGTLSYETAREAVSFFSNCTVLGAQIDWVDLSYADVEVELSAEAQPYASLFAYQTFIDGQPRAHFNTNFMFVPPPVGRDRVTADCAKRSSNPAGVRFEATLPDGTKLSTPEISIDLTCKGPAPKLPEGALPRALDAGVTADTSTQDEGCALTSSRSGCSGLLVALALLLRRRIRNKR